jgi:plastocyanin
MRVHHALLLATLAVACGGGGAGTGPSAVASVVINPRATITSFTPGAKIALTAAAKDATGAALTTLTPTWSVSNAAVLSVSATSALTTTVTALATGTAQVIATSSGKADTVNITVVAQAFTGVSVSPPSTELSPAATAQLVAKAVDQNGIQMAGSGFAAPTFVSTNTAVATVDAASGIVTAVGNGSATINASVIGNGVTKTGSSAITVAVGGGFPPTATVAANGSYSWDPPVVDIAVGGTVTFLNQTTFTHNVTFTTGTGVPSNIADWTGDSRGATFATVGTFKYACSIHPGMQGTVVVH